MKFAVVARPPVFGGKVKSFDDAETLKVPGVLKIVAIDGTPAPAKFQPLGGVAVVATNTWAAMKGREALKISGTTGRTRPTSEAYTRPLEETARKPGKGRAERGRRGRGAGQAPPRGSRRNTTSRIWPTRRWSRPPPPCRSRTASARSGPASSRPRPRATDLAKSLGMPFENVTVNVTLLGGGFGRKSKPDFAVEAALLSKEMGGAPVKLTWTREDDIPTTTYHTVSVERIEAGMDAAGKPMAWLHRSVAPSIMSIFAPDPKQEAAVRAGHGAGRRAVRHPQPAMRERRGRGAYPHRLVPVGVEHPARLRRPVLRGGDGAAAGKDQKDYLLELIGAAPGRTR